MSDLLAALDSLRERLKEIPQADERRLQELKTELLGRKAGALTEILKALPGLESEERKRVGGQANALKRELERAIDDRESDLKRSSRRSSTRSATSSKSSASRASLVRKPRPSATTSTR